MEEKDEVKKHNWFYKFDGLLKPFIPNFNVRAVLYLSVIFAVALYLQIWRITSPKPNSHTTAKKETIIADQSYWSSKEYKDKIQNQTVASFTQELQDWLDGKSNEFIRRKFEDIVFINSGLTPMTGGDLTTIVPKNFNYLENVGLARYQYTKAKGFLGDKPLLVSLGNIVCDLDQRTEKATGIKLYDWRYASMPKLANFMTTNPDWKVQVSNNILDVSDPLIEDKNVLKLENTQTQRVGLFSFLIFHDPKTNRITLADETMLENNAIDANQSLSRIGSIDKQPKLYFKYGYQGCQQINEQRQVNYGQPD